MSFRLYDYLPILLMFVVAGGFAVGNVLLKHILLDPSERCASGRDLGDDVDAVAILFNHAGNAPHLSLDAVEAFEPG